MYYSHCSPHRRGVSLAPAETAALHALGLRPASGLSGEQGPLLYTLCDFDAGEHEFAQLAAALDRDHGGRVRLVNAVDGMDRVASKQSLWTLVRQAYGRLRSQIYVPETWDLSDRDDAAHYARHVAGRDAAGLFVIKDATKQRQEGIAVVRGAPDPAALGPHSVVQRATADPLVVGGRKVTLRYYLLCVCLPRTGTVSFWVYQDGFVYYAARPYASGTADPRALVASGYTARDVYQHSPLTLMDLTAHLQRDTGDGAARLADNVAYVLAGVAAALAPAVCARPPRTLFQLFGADVQPDAALDHPVVLEINKAPDLAFKDPRDRALKTGMVRDMYELALRLDAMDAAGAARVYRGAVESGWRCTHVRSRQ